MTYRIFFQVFAFGMLCVCLFFALDLFAQNFIDEKTTRGDVGDYFTFTIGIPASLFTALVIGIVGNEISNRQGDVEVLEFVEKKASSLLETVRFYIDFLSFAITTANVLRYSIWESYKVAEKNYKPSKTTTDQVYFDDFTEQDYHEFHEMHKNAYLSDISAIKALNTVKFVVNELSEEITKRKTDIYLPVALNKAHAEFSGRDDPYVMLKSCLPYGFFETFKEFDDLDLLLPTDHIQVVRTVRILFGSPMILEDDVNPLKFTFPDGIKMLDIFQVHWEVPDKEYSLEYIGMSLARTLIKFDGQQYFEYEGKQIKADGIYINIGAVLLLKLCQFLPFEKSVRELFESIIGHRSVIARRLLDTLKPTASNLHSKYWFEGIQKQLEYPERLLILRVNSGTNLFFTPDMVKSLKNYKLVSGEVEGNIQPILRKR